MGADQEDRAARVRVGPVGWVRRRGQSWLGTRRWKEDREAFAHGLAEIRENLADGAKGIARKEEFGSAKAAVMEQEGWGDEEWQEHAQEMLRALRRRAMICWAVAGALLVYGVYMAYRLHSAAFLVNAGIWALVLGIFGLRAAFRHWQVRRQRLGSLGEWWREGALWS